ncbi:hypothetical protein RT97_27820 [Variovorax paradoxus]|uniref:Uncharacterized protein n=1 Tax=Variovorax paradoxus TaxID=34073 RepID=A0A0D0LLW9_VARPD|nr:hypothetical protein [Variovorax paradoxus]KIQ21001.1 hypothetical protein RT97_27820 [Variovorax paradoxus]
MSGTRSEVERFFRTLLLGDFEEDQHFGAQIVGGLISLIPILDQVMDARDITGTLFKINQRGGFDKASADQLVNLGFAAFGAIPEVGSAFKTVFKPLWKERRAVKGAVHSGLQAVEGLLGLGKGGAIKWIRHELLGKWVARSNAAIQQVDVAMASCIELLEFVSTATGWKDWLIPDPVQRLAKELLPGLKQMRGQIRAPLQRASKEIREFLEDLLGEQAAAIVMAAGERAVAASATPGTRPKTGHNAAELRPQGRVSARQTEKKVGGRTETDTKRGGGPLHVATQLTRKAFSSLANQEKGLVGEHMVDYYELERLGGTWPHDKPKGSWKPETVRKLNVDKRPVNLSLSDLPKVNQSGIDAVWQHGGSYTVTEAKARESIFAIKANVDKRGSATVKSMSEDQQLLYYLLSDSSDKRGVQFRTVQMSEDWVRDRATREGLPAAANAALRTPRNRRVVLVTFESDGALAHGQALTDIHMGKPEAAVHPHPEHGITKQWEAAAIDAVVRARERARAVKNAKQSSEAPTGNKPTKANKPSK